MYSSPPMDSSYSSFNDSVFGRTPDAADAQKGGVLFGNKRRSMAVSRTPSFMSNANPIAGISSPSADIFASPAPTSASALPSHMRESTPSGGGKSVHWSPALVQDRNLSSPLVKSSPRLTDSATSNAPPLRSLRDDLEPSRKTCRRSLSTTISHPLNQSNSSIIMGTDSSPDIMETTSSNDNWVTVFGFSPEQAYIVLQFFSRHGEIVQHQTPSKGNWMHLGYSTPIHARQALARNGVIIDGNTRVGVIATPEKELTDANVTSPVLNTSSYVPNNLNTSTLNRSAIVEQIIHEDIEIENSNIAPNHNQSISVMDNSLNNSRMSMASRAGMRPLSSSFRRPDVQMEEKQETSFLGKIWNTVGF